MPLTVSRLSADLVEVWGAVRPATSRVAVDVSASAGGGFTRVARPRTNPAGYFRIRLRRSGVARLGFRTQWRSPAGVLMRSRTARAGRPIRYQTERR